MRLIELADAATFLQRTSALLLASEAESGLLLSSVLTLARSSVGRSPKLSYFVVEDCGKALCAALHFSEKRLLISTATQGAAIFLGVEFANRKIAVRAVLGPLTAAQSFASRYSRTCGDVLARKQTQYVLRLDTPPLFSAAPGLWRAAREKDKDILVKWSLDFVMECGLEEPQDETVEVVCRYLEERRLFIWEHQHPVAMAGYGGLTPNGARVNMVYTAPESRSRGFAASLVSGLSRRLLSSGKHRYCYLFVDAENEAANRVYQRLGYIRVGEAADFR